jgi:uncharacterized protein (TIGR03435 family)
MRSHFKLECGIGLILAAAAGAQSAKTFDVASVKPNSTDMMKLAAAAQSDPQGFAAHIGMHVHPARVEFGMVDLKTLIAWAYNLKPYQVSGPEWLSQTRLDITATYPPGTPRADIFAMLQALLKDRVKLQAHMETKEQPVLALVVAKGGPKLVESKELPKAIDGESPLKPGEMQADMPEGPVRQTMDMKSGTGEVDMGLKGKMGFKIDMPKPGTTPDPSAMAFHLDGKEMTMAGLVEMLSQFSAQIGGKSGRQIVDMTGLTAHYDVSLSIPFTDLIAMARTQGLDMPNAPPGGAGNPAMAASEPTGAGSMFASVQGLGLKLESRRAVIDQLVVDHAEKSPVEN